MPMNMKMPTMVGIFIFIGREKFMLNVKFSMPMNMKMPTVGIFISAEKIHAQLS